MTYGVRFFQPTSLEAMRQGSTYLKNQHGEFVKSWNHFMAKSWEQLEGIQNSQSMTSKAAQEIRANTAEMAKQAKSISKMQTWAHWGYPLASAVLVSLLWTGFALWQMPDFGTLGYNQKMIYSLLEKVEAKIPTPAGGGKK